MQTVRSKLRVRAQERPAARTLLRMRPSRIQSSETAAQSETATSNPNRPSDPGGWLGEAVSDGAVIDQEQLIMVLVDHDRQDPRRFGTRSPHLGGKLKLTGRSRRC